MRFRIPPELKETVTAVRRSAFEHGDETVIAENVICLVVPGRDLVGLGLGIPVKQSDLRSDWTILLERRNPVISEGDFLYRADGAALQVYGIRLVGNVMLLEINNVTIP